MRITNGQERKYILFWSLLNSSKIISLWSKSSCKHNHFPLNWIRALKVMKELFYHGSISEISPTLFLNKHDESNPSHSTWNKHLMTL